MSNVITRIPEMTIGIDVGDKCSHYYELDAEGNLVSAGQVATTNAGFRRFYSDRPARVAIEAGAHSMWVGKLLRAMGHEVLIANPRKLRLIYDNDRKNDKLDAELLARLARVDPELLSPIEHRAEEKQGSLTVLRARDLLVRSRTELVNSVRGMMKIFGLKLPSCSAESFHRKMVGLVRAELTPILETIAAITERIHEYDKTIDKLATTVYPEVQALTQVNGVGNLTALAFVLTLGDPHRFTKSRDVGAYLGLCPRESTSSSINPQLGISKAGNDYLRRLMVGSAHYIMGPFGKDSALRQFGHRKAEHGGANGKKRAVVAVARKLAVLLHRLWTTGELYEPLRGAQPAPSTAA